MTKSIFATYQSIIGKLNYIVFLLLIISLPFPTEFKMRLWPIWLITWALEFRFVERSNFRFRRSFYAVAMMVGFFLWNALSILWSNNPAQGWSDIERALSVLALPLIALYGVNRHYKSYQIQTAIVGGTVASVLVYSFVVFFCYEADLIHLFPTYAPLLALSEGPIAILKHRLFYCIVMLVAIGCTGNLYKHYIQQYSKSKVITTLVVANLIILTGIFFTSSRSTLLILPIYLILLFLFNTNHSFKSRTLIITTLVIFVAGAMIVLTNPRFKYIFSSRTTESIYTTPSPDNPRAYIYYTVISHWKSYGFFGLGIGSEQDFLVQQYEQQQQPLALFRKWHAHSEYLNTWMRLGPLGPLVLLAIVICFPVFFSGTARKDAILLSINYGWAMVTDLVLSFADPLYSLFVLWVILEIEQREDLSQPLRP